MGNPFKSLKRFYNNEVKDSPAFAGIRMLGQLANPKTWYGPLDQWLGTDLSGDRAAARAEEQRRYELGLAREDNAYQRAYADARAAGINPNIHGIQPASSSAAAAGDVMAGRVDASQGNFGNLFGALTSLAGLGIQQKQVANQAQQIANTKAYNDASLALKSQDSSIRSEAQSLINSTIRHDLAIAQGHIPPDSQPGYHSYRNGPPQLDPATAIMQSAVDYLDNNDSETMRWIKESAPYKVIRGAVKHMRKTRSGGKR